MVVQKKNNMKMQTTESDNTSWLTIELDDMKGFIPLYVDEGSTITISGSCISPSTGRLEFDLNDWEQADTNPDTSIFDRKCLVKLKDKNEIEITYGELYQLKMMKVNPTEMNIDEFRKAMVAVKL